MTAHLSERVLSAVITTPSETYHVEPSAHLIKEPHNFHMLLYAQSHVRPRLNASRVDFVTPPTLHIMNKDGTHSHSTLENGMWTAGERLRRQNGFRGNIAGDLCSMILIADYSTFLLFGSVNSASIQIVSHVATMSGVSYDHHVWCCVM